MRIFIFLIWIVFVLNHSLLAQISSSLEVSSAFDDNVFRSPEPTEDFISDLNLDLGYRFNNSNLQINYSGNFIFYRSLKERNLSLHQLNLNYYAPFGKDNRHTFYIGGNGLTRIDGEEYEVYDYNQLYAYANFRFDFESLFLKTGYNIRYRDYSNIPELTNLRHYLFIQANKSFSTHTTLILEADLGYKTFKSQVFYSRDNEDFDDGSHGSGGQMRPSRFATSILEVPPMGQLILLGRVAQSVYEKMGIFVQYRKQISLSDQVTSITANNFYRDEELFDDPFSYEGQGISTQLTWMMPWSMKLQIGGSLIDKNYISEQAFVSIDDTIGTGGQRIDDQNNLYLNFTKTFNFKRNWMNALMFNFYFGYTNNKSNSYWYNYTNRIIGGGIQWRF